MFRRSRKAVGCAAGLGVLGDNGLLITPRWGSFVFIGEIITLSEAPPEPAPLKFCAHCGRCSAACPSPDSCLSALTQKKGALSAGEEELIRRSGSVWGCDICQLACPCNDGAEETAIPEFARVDRRPLCGVDGLAPGVERKFRTGLHLARERRAQAQSSDKPQIVVEHRGKGAGKADLSGTFKKDIKYPPHTGAKFRSYIFSAAYKKRAKPARAGIDDYFKRGPGHDTVFGSYIAYQRENPAGERPASSGAVPGAAGESDAPGKSFGPFPGYGEKPRAGGKPRFTRKKEHSALAAVDLGAGILAAGPIAQMTAVGRDGGEGA